MVKAAAWEDAKGALRMTKSQSISPSVLMALIFETKKASSGQGDFITNFRNCCYSSSSGGGDAGT